MRLKAVPYASHVAWLRVLAGTTVALACTLKQAGAWLPRRALGPRGYRSQPGFFLRHLQP